MKNIELACYALLASAFVLASVLVVQLQRGNTLLPQANAEMVLNRNNITMMTGRTKDDEEALFVIENNSEMMLIYLLDIGRKQVEFKHAISLRKAFGGGNAGGPNMGGGNDDRRSRRVDR